MANDPIKPPIPPATVTPIKPTVTPVTPVTIKVDESEKEELKKEREAFLKQAEKDTIEFLKFPEVRKITRTEFLNQVKSILDLHSSDSNSAIKAYNEIEAITPN